MKVIKSQLVGFCHGVSNTINKATQCIGRAENENLPCYSVGKLIHNDDVVRLFEDKGMRVIKSPEGNAPGIALVRAHGIADALRGEFESKGFILIDSTCVNILKTQNSIRQASETGKKIIILGAEGHAETITLMGTRRKGKDIEKFVVSTEEDAINLCRQFPADTPVITFTQTTFARTLYVAILKILVNHFTNLEVGSHLCKACVQRKNAAFRLSQICPAILVVGGKNSHNTQDLVKYVSWKCENVYTVENADDFTPELEKALKKYPKVGVCSGTSTPQGVIDQVVAYLEAL